MKKYITKFKYLKTLTKIEIILLLLFLLVPIYFSFLIIQHSIFKGTICFGYSFMALMAVKDIVDTEYEYKKLRENIAITFDTIDKGVKHDD